MQLVFGVYKNSDMTEGRGTMILDQLFSERPVAVHYMDQQEGVQGVRAKWSEGTHGSDWEVRELTVAESIDEVLDQRREALRQSALAKLTTKEREALGLDS